MLVDPSHVLSLINTEGSIPMLKALPGKVCARPFLAGWVWVQTTLTGMGDTYVPTTAFTMYFMVIAFVSLYVGRSEKLHTL